MMPAAPIGKDIWSIAMLLVMETPDGPLEIQEQMYFLCRDLAEAVNVAPVRAQEIADAKGFPLTKSWIVNASLSLAGDQLYDANDVGLPF